MIRIISSARWSWQLWRIRRQTKPEIKSLWDQYTEARKRHRPCHLILSAMRESVHREMRKELGRHG